MQRGDLRHLSYLALAVDNWQYQSLGAKCSSSKELTEKSEKRIVLRCIDYGTIIKVFECQLIKVDMART